MQRTTSILSGLAVAVTVAFLTGACASPSAQLSDSPDTAFKLATIETDGAMHVGLVLGERVVDIAGANDHLVAEAGVDAMAMPGDMRTLIEEYATVSPRLYQMANYFGENGTADMAFAYDVGAVKIRAPIEYPWNVVSAAANYKAHAQGMAGEEEEEEAQPQRRGGFDPSMIDDIVPERDAPVMFAKSPRSCIIGTGEPYYIPPGRDRIDWEGELAIIMGQDSYLVDRANAHDYVFGYSILYDVSDRGGRTREISMFPGANWFDGKSTNRGAPFGPFIVPKEFLPNHENLRVVTKVNGVVKQDQTTADLIWNEANLIAYTTSILQLYPGDVIATGTPAGTAREHDPAVYLKAGDVVTIEIEGIGTLETPIEAYPGS